MFQARGTQPTLQTRFWPLGAHRPAWRCKWMKGGNYAMRYTVAEVLGSQLWKITGNSNSDLEFSNLLLPLRQRSFLPPHTSQLLLSSRTQLRCYFPCWVLGSLFLLCTHGSLSQFSSVQCSHSVVSNSLRPPGRSTPGCPVHHQLLELTQPHVHQGHGQ